MDNGPVITAAEKQENVSHIREISDIPARLEPHLHVPRLVLSEHHRGKGILTTIADIVNKVVGSMYVFVGVTLFIVIWLFAGNIVSFDKTPWPLLLTILNLPQLSIMISLQVSANLAQKTSDARAMADHETLIALHELAKQQVTILEGQNKILDILKDRVGPAASEFAHQQSDILQNQAKILDLISRGSTA